MGRRTGAWVPRRLDAPLLAAPVLCAVCLLCRWQPFAVPPLIAAAGLAPPLVVPTAMTALAALVLRRPAAAVAGITCMLFAGAVLLPRGSPDASVRRPATPITLLTANLYFRNPDPEAAVEAVISVGADVVILQEVSPELAAVLETRSASAGYLWTVIRPRWGSTGLAVLSRHRVVEHEMLSLRGQPLLRVDVDVAGTVLRLFDVHIEAPTSRKAAGRWEAQLGSLRDVLESSPGPLVAAGDFNATQGHRALRRLLSPTLRDVGHRHASPWLATWPTGLPVLPALMQLDHVLASSSLASTGLRAGRCPGSDHKLVVTSIVIPAPSAVSVSPPTGD